MCENRCGKACLSGLLSNQESNQENVDWSLFVRVKEMSNKVSSCWLTIIKRKEGPESLALIFLEYFRWYQCTHGMEGFCSSLEENFIRRQ